MQTVCAAGETVPGYDVSSYQDVSVHAQQAAAGAKFCFIKAEEGFNEDPKFVAHWAAAKAAGMFTGAYNFFHPSVDPIAQAQKFKAIVGPIGPGDLGPVIDWESTDGVPPFQDMNDGFNFLTALQSEYGRGPIVYSAAYFIEAMSLDDRFLAFPLWVANYGVRCPLVPAPWKYWSFWQYGTQNNILDMDVFNGSYDRLKLMAGL